MSRLPSSVHDGVYRIFGERAKMEVWTAEGLLGAVEGRNLLGGFQENYQGGILLRILTLDL